MRKLTKYEPGGTMIDSYKSTLDPEDPRNYYTSGLTGNIDYDHPIDGAAYERLAQETGIRPIKWEDLNQDQFNRWAQVYTQFRVRNYYSGKGTSGERKLDMLYDDNGNFRGYPEDLSRIRSNINLPSGAQYNSSLANTNYPRLTRRQAIDAVSGITNGDRRLARQSYRAAKEYYRDQGLRGRDLRQSARRSMMDLAQNPDRYENDKYNNPFYIQMVSVDGKRPHREYPTRPLSSSGSVTLSKPLMEQVPRTTPAPVTLQRYREQSTIGNSSPVTSLGTTSVDATEAANSNQPQLKSWMDFYNEYGIVPDKGNEYYNDYEKEYDPNTYDEAQKEFDKLSFGNAFNAARHAYDEPWHTFTWRGGKYNTAFEEEWNAKYGKK